MSEDQPNYVDRRQWKYDPMTGNRLWQGLTENEKELLWDEAVEGREHFCSQYGDFADAIEAKLKQKNA
jgi:hypothetical protein